MAATQQDTLRIFTALRLVRQTWAGSLLVGVGLGDAGRALALAALAAGAASIFLETDVAYLRAAQREGCCTFTVTSLDEALRIVKNELRQRHAITVGLRGDPAAWLQEMVERGVQPQAFATSRLLLGSEVASVNVLYERGMQTYCGLGLHGTQSGSIDLEIALTLATSGAWALHEQLAVSSVERRTQDAALREAITHGDAMGVIASHWLQAAPALFPRVLDRTYWLKNNG
jgi:hypothetical protein